MGIHKPPAPPACTRAPPPRCNTCFLPTQGRASSPTGQRALLQPHVLAGGRGGLHSRFHPSAPTGGAPVGGVPPAPWADSRGANPCPPVSTERGAGAARTPLTRPPDARAELPNRAPARGPAGLPRAGRAGGAATLLPPTLETELVLILPPRAPTATAPQPTPARAREATGACANRPQQGEFSSSSRRVNSETTPPLLHNGMGWDGPSPAAPPCERHSSNTGAGEGKAPDTPEGCTGRRPFSSDGKERLRPAGLVHARLGDGGARAARST